MTHSPLGNGDRRIAVLDALGLLDPHHETRFNTVLAMCSEYFLLPHAAIALAGRTNLILRAQHGFTEEALLLAGSFTEAVMLTNGTLIIEDATKDSRFATHAMVVGPPNIRLFVGQALHAHGGEVIGAFTMSSPQTPSFGKEDQSRFRQVAQWIEEELARETDQKRAAEVQRALTPRYVELPGYELVGASTPAHVVSGDFFDWHLTDGGLAVTLAGVNGEGVGAALIAATVRAVLRATRPSMEVDESVGIASRILEEELNGTDSSTTLFHATVNAADGVVTYIDAGHSFTLVVRADGSYDHLTYPDPALGANLDQSWTRRTTALNPGDTLISFNGGVLDVFGGGTPAFDSLAALVTRSASVADALSILTSMSEDNPDTDDVVVVAVRRKAQ